MQSVTETGWHGSSDPSLLEIAQSRFDVFVAEDRKIEVQNELGSFRLGFILARVPNNRLESFEPIFGELRAAAGTVHAGAWSAPS